MTETYTLPDARRSYDHGGELVAPLSSDGTPFAYAWRQEDMHRTTFATTADAMLSCIISGYDATPGTDRASHAILEDQRLTQRAQHALGVTVNHAAQAMLTGSPDDITQVLQRSTDYSRPLDHTELPEWNHEIPLVLIGAFYGPGQNLTPPAGNVVLLTVDTPEQYLRDLHTAGAINLFEHSQVTTAAVTVAVDLDPDPAQGIRPRLGTLDESLRAVRGEATELNVQRMRERTNALLTVLDATPVADVDTAKIRERLDKVAGDGEQEQRVTRRYLSRPVHSALGDNGELEVDESVEERQ